MREASASVREESRATARMPAPSTSSATVRLTPSSQDGLWPRLAATRLSATLAATASPANTIHGFSQFREGEGAVMRRTKSRLQRANGALD